MIKLLENKMERTNSRSIFLFLISPILGLVEAFRDLKSKQSRQVLFGFCLCFGICFSVGIERFEGSSDGISMRQEFEEAKNLTTDQYISYLSDYFEFDRGAQDIYIVSVAFFVGKFTENYHFFFLFLAFVFAFFQLKCLRYFVKEKNYNNSIICVILVCLFLWNNIYNINGARFWTAAWIGLFCLFKVLYDKKPLYILVSASTLLVHASFAVFPAVLLLAYLLKGGDKSLLVMFIASWVFSIFAEDYKIPFLGNMALPFLIGKKVEYYTDSNYIESLSNASFGSGFYWVQILFRSIARHYIDLLILLVALNKKHIFDKRTGAIIGGMIVFATLSNFGMIVPTFGGRFFAMNYALVAYSFLVTFGDKKFKTLVYLLPLVWFMNLFYLAKDIIAVLDFGFLLSPIISFVRFAIL